MVGSVLRPIGDAGNAGKSLLEMQLGRQVVIRLEDGLGQAPLQSIDGRLRHSNLAVKIADVLDLPLLIEEGGHRGIERGDNSEGGLRHVLEALTKFPRDCWALAQEERPTAAQRATVQAFVATYFKRLDDAEYAKARAMFLPPVQSRMSQSDFDRAHEQYLSLFGAVVDRKVRGFNWHLKGSNVGTGTAVVAVYSGSSSKDHRFCGHLIIAEMEEAVFQLFKDDRTYFTDAHMKAASPEVRRQTLDRPGCKQFLERF